jgi:hypothetical protein
MDWKKDRLLTKFHSIVNESKLSLLMYRFSVSCRRNQKNVSDLTTFHLYLSRNRQIFDRLLMYELGFFSVLMLVNVYWPLHLFFCFIKWLVRKKRWVANHIDSHQDHERWRFMMQNRSVTMDDRNTLDRRTEVSAMCRRDHHCWNVQFRRRKKILH